MEEMKDERDERDETLLRYTIFLLLLLEALSSY